MPMLRRHLHEQVSLRLHARCLMPTDNAIRPPNRSPPSHTPTGFVLALFVVSSCAQENLSAPARSRLEALPDLSFMLSDRIRFPMRGFVYAPGEA